MYIKGKIPKEIPGFYESLEDKNFPFEFIINNRFIYIVAQYFNAHHFINLQIVLNRSNYECLSSRFDSSLGEEMESMNIVVSIQHNKVYLTSEKYSLFNCEF
jgi:hypothetical protein